MKQLIYALTLILSAFASADNPCDLFNVETGVDQWPAVIGEAYGVIDYITTNSGETIIAFVTFTKPTGEQFTSGPHIFSAKETGFIYHITLPCWFAEQGWADAKTTVFIPLGCPDHSSYFFFVRSPDLNCDGMVDVHDLQAMIDKWGSCGGAMCLQDMDIDDQVRVIDLIFLLNHWGPQ